MTMIPDSVQEAYARVARKMHGSAGEDIGQDAAEIDQPDETARSLARPTRRESGVRGTVGGPTGSQTRRRAGMRRSTSAAGWRT